MKKLLNKGFTIVELVIVIAVIGILAAVLIPTFSNVIESANETADLQEAQSTLKAYTAYMTSKGTPLSDGAVFKIEKTGRTYVFYKGELHKFEGKETKLNTTPVVKIGAEEFSCNYYFVNFIDEEKIDGGTDDKGAKQYITFFYSDKKNVQFDDGSLKCQIYPGLVVKTYTEITDDTTDASLATDKLWENIDKKTKYQIFSVTGDNKKVTALGTVTLTATVIGDEKANKNVTFEIVSSNTDCSIDGATFTAGNTAGDVQVKVTSVQDSTKSNTFIVKVTAESAEE